MTELQYRNRNAELYSEDCARRRYWKAEANAQRLLAASSILFVLALFARTVLV